MPRYLVETLYQTPSGNANGHRCWVAAPNEDAAFEAAGKLCRRDRRVMKIDGGDILETCPDLIPVTDPDLKVAREVYRALAGRLGLKVGTYSESSATLEAGEPFDPKLTVEIPGWLAERMIKLTAV